MKPSRKQKGKAEDQQEQSIPKSIYNSHDKYINLIISGKPNSKCSKITEITDECIGVAIAAQPRDGEANEELLSYLSSVLQVKKNMLSLDRGSKSRHKVITLLSEFLRIEYVHQLLIAAMNE